MLPDRLVHFAATQPDSPAIIEGAITTTYQDLHRLVGVVTSLLDGEDRPVAIWTSTLRGTVVAVLASLASARMFIPLDPRDSPARVRNIIDSMDVQMVLSDEDAFGPDPAVFTVNVLTGNTAPVAIVHQKDCSAAPFAYALHTSGSTGNPKPIRHRYGTLEAVGANFVSAVDLGRGDRLAVAASLAHDAVLVDISASVMSGATMVRLDILNPRFVRNPRAWFANNDIAIVHCVPTVGRRILSRMQTSPPEASRVRAWVFGGEAASEQFLQDVAICTPQASAYLLYGQTECSIIGIHRVCSPRDAGLVGSPVQGVEYRTRTYTDSQAVLEIRGTLVSPDVPLASPQDRDGWRSTGDLVRVEGDHIRFVGRHDDVVKIRGERISRLEIESVLRGLPGVQDAAVVVAAEDDPQLCAIVQSTESLSLPDVNAAIAASLGSWARIHRLEITHHELPALPSGKLDRRRAAQVFSEISDATVPA